MQLTDSKIVAEFVGRTTASRKLAEQARDVFPGGVTHDARFVRPYPIYVDHAEGSRKWDVDGNEYVDYVGGHGALLLGHNHPKVVEALRQQLSLGTHYGSCHELELRWGEIVKRLMPSAQRVRFTSSGTEATLLAIRLARAFTGRTKIVRFAANFHGWQDHVCFGVGSHYDGTATPGVLPEVTQNVVLCPPGDMEEVHRALVAADDVAAVILEPTGATWGQVPIAESFLNELREVTAGRDVLLIFDEVVSGFRCSPGGAQAYYSITPDLTTLAKILAGGLPGGALVGRRDVLDWLDYDASAAAGHEKITHHGTFNANPISATAGVSALEIVEQTDACQRASRYADELRDALRRVLREEHVAWSIYGSFSGFHIFTNPERAEVTAEQINAGTVDFRQIKSASDSQVAKKLRLGMLIHGVDIFAWPGAPTSAVHDSEDLERTVAAFQQTLRIIKQEGDV